MNLADLANNLTVRLAEVTHIYSPRRLISINFVLYPTVGKAFTDDISVMRGFGCQWHEDNGVDQEAVVTAFLGKPTEDIVTAILAQYVEFAAGRTYSPQFTRLFTYIQTVGLAT